MAINWKQNYQTYKNLFLKNYQYYKQKEEIRSYVELILSLTAIVVFANFAIKPTAITIIDLNKEIKAKQETIKKMDTKIGNLQKAQEILNQEKTSIDRLDKAIPTKPEAEDFLRVLAATAFMNNITVKSISVDDIIISGKHISPPKSNLNLPPEIIMISVSASFEGNYTNANEFLKKIEKFIRPLEFEQLTISTSQARGEESISKNLNISLSAKIPYYQTSTTPDQKDDKQSPDSSNSSSNSNSIERSD